MAQGKHDGKPGKRRALLIVEIICVIVVIACVALIFMQVSKYWTANNEFNAITEEYDRNPNALVTDNPNCVGWVSVADTRIDYPVMYTPNDPEYYLHRNFEGNESAAGTPFLGKGCLLDGNSAIIYGHNMNDGSMFAAFADYSNLDFANEHARILVQTPEAKKVYLARCVDIVNGTELAKRTDFNDETDYREWYDSQLSGADVVIDAITQPQTAITFCTCSYNYSSNERTLVVASPDTAYLID